MEMTVTVLSQISEAMRTLVEKTSQRVVAVNAGSRRAASGIVWRAGLIVTADEALGDEDDVELTMPNGNVAVGTLAGRDASTDIALLRAEGSFANLAAFAPASNVKAGHLAIAVGRAHNGQLAATGMIKECGGSWRSWTGGLIDQRILLDLALDRRCHGGAVVDASGNLIGLAAFAPRNRALVIPTQTIDRIADRLAAKGSIGPGYLGVGLHPLRHERGGAIVVGLDENGPAKLAGICIGDTVIAWNGEPIRAVRDVLRRLGPDTVGSTITLEVIRADQRTKVEVAVGERPHK
jgi:S1-C subfamily serine protease